MFALFPMMYNDVSEEEIETRTTKQLDVFTALLKDEYPAIRCIGK